MAHHTTMEQDAETIIADSTTTLAHFLTIMPERSNGTDDEDVESDASEFSYMDLGIPLRASGNLLRFAPVHLFTDMQFRQVLELQETLGHCAWEDERAEAYQLVESMALVVGQQCRTFARLQMFGELLWGPLLDECVEYFACDWHTVAMAAMLSTISNTGRAVRGCGLPPICRDRLLHAAKHCIFDRLESRNKPVLQTGAIRMVGLLGFDNDVDSLQDFDFLMRTGQIALTSDAHDVYPPELVGRVRAEATRACAFIRGTEDDAASWHPSSTSGLALAVADAIQRRPRPD